MIEDDRVMLCPLHRLGVRDLLGIAGCEEREVLKRWRRLAEEYMLLFHRTWDDLVIVVQMRRLGISEIYSNDQDFNKVPYIHRLF